MDLEFTSDDIRFRDEVRAWLAEALTEDLKRRMALSKNGSLDEAHQKAWLKKLADKGWLAINWPTEYGGPGWSQTQKYIFEMEFALAGAPRMGSMGVRMCAPVIMKFGTEEQKKRFLPPILKSDVWWCQGYSEPGSGSDLASLQMSARREGDYYVLNGSKTWTTHAQWADWIFCLVRTSKEPKRQQGISFILVDMKSPGITISPIHTLDYMKAGDQEINQVFFEDVRVPAENLIGQEGEGWTCAKYLLTFERGSAYAPGCRHALRKAREQDLAVIWTVGAQSVLPQQLREPNDDALPEFETPTKASGGMKRRFTSAEDVCAAWNNGKCSKQAKDCPHLKAHCCNFVENGQICGKWQHTSMVHRK